MNLFLYVPFLSSLVIVLLSIVNIRERGLWIKLLKNLAILVFDGEMFVEK